MEYSFKISFNNGKIKEIRPKELENGKLADFDKFTMDSNMKTFLEEQAKLEGLTPYDITKTTILCKTRNNTYEANLINDNPYFYDIYNNLTKVAEYGKPPIVKLVILRESECYREMKDWLFKGLKTEGHEFVKRIYGQYPNDFSKLLDKYVSTLNSYHEGEEDYYTETNLEIAIRDGLSVYSNYRGLAGKRYYNEKNNYIRKVEPKFTPYQPTKKDLELKNKQLEEYYNSIDNPTANTDNFNKKYLDEDYEEFTEEDEYDQMTGGIGKVL